MDSVIHFEIPTKDMERAKKFYKTLFDWQLQDMPEMNYCIVRTAEVDEKQMPKEPGTINGGLMNDETVSFPVIVIRVENLEKKVEDIARAGGTLVMSTVNVGGMGLYARVRDTEGNIIGVWQDLK